MDSHLIMGGASLGDPADRGPPGRQRPSGAAAAPDPVRRCGFGSLPPREDGEQEYVKRLRQRVARDLVAEIADLLASDALLRLDGAAPRPVAASDLAVLVRRNVGR